MQRWHAEHGLPVHHFGGTQGCVFAYVEELDKWLTGVGSLPGHRRASDRNGGDPKKTIAAELTASADEMWTARSEKNLPSIAGLYREALDKDPGNVRALTGLASAMIISALMEVVDSSVAHTCAMEALRRMPQFDSQHIDARCCAGFLKMVHERKWRQAKAGFDELLTEQPSHSFGLVGRALLHLADGEFQDASRLAWEAWRNNPLVSSKRLLLCWIQFLAGESAEALELVRQFRASGSFGASMATIEALALSQAAPDVLNIGQIVRFVAEFPENRTLQAILGYAFAVSGNTESALQILNVLEEMCERKKKNCGYALALILIGLGRKQEAIPWLETSFEQGTLWSLGFRSDPILKALRGEPRFEALLRKIGSQTETLAIDQPRFMPEALRTMPASIAVGTRGHSSSACQDCLVDLGKSGAA